MASSQDMWSCIYNLLFTQFNQDIGVENLFRYNLQYPVFYNLQNNYFRVDPEILNNISSTIKTDVYDFRDGLLEDKNDYNNSSAQNALPKRSYTVTSNYAVTFSKNHILSVILDLRGNAGTYGPRYDELNNYNYDLLTGNIITLKNIFNEGVDYIRLITDYVTNKINQNKDLYYPNITVEIPNDQSFYLTDDGIVIYFGVDEIAPEEFGIPMFKLNFNNFAPYINTRLYCSAQNLSRRKLHRRF